jgi:hypothetical protein
MTSNRLFSPAGLCTGLTFFLLLGTAVAIAASSACGSDPTTTNDFIGVTDATPPRLGKSDAGAAR